MTAVGSSHPGGRKGYTSVPTPTAIQMIDTVRRATLLVLYQFSILLGILVFPLALAARHAGVPLPMHRVIERLGSAYENAA